jgi:hypothetical protein
LNEIIRIPFKNIIVNNKINENSLFNIFKKLNGLNFFYLNILNIPKLSEFKIFNINLPVDFLNYICISQFFKRIDSLPFLFFSAVKIRKKKNYD